MAKHYIHSWKSFDWSEETQDDDFVENLREVDQNSFRIIYHEDPIPASEYSLKFVPWESFVNKFDETSAVPSRPVIVTEDNTGRWRFYPPMDRPYTVAFDYVRTPQEVVDFDDEFKGIPEEYQDVIMWKALQYYGAYDEQPSVVARATKNYKEMMYRLEMQEREKFHFKPVRLF